MSVNVKVIVHTVPAICMILGFLFIVVGYEAGWVLIVLGFIARKMVQCYLEVKASRASIEVGKILLGTP
jgi:hypothetical protein